MERSIRARKRKVAGLKTAVDHCKDAETKADLQEMHKAEAAKLARQNAAYREFCKVNDLKVFYDRLKIHK